jgi:hypothetical protein
MYQWVKHINRKDLKLYEFMISTLARIGRTGQPRMDNIETSAK